VTLADLALATCVWLGFLTVLFAASRWLPGPEQDGRPGPDGARRRYRLNGLAVFVFVLAIVALTTLTGGWSPSLLLRFAWPLFAAANLIALAASLILWLAGRRAGPCRVSSFVTGVEKDPRWLGVDLKLFLYRPSLTALALLNVAFALAQWERHGTVSVGMWLYQAFTFVYVANYFHFERGMLFTWDLLEERFGLALVWGDLVLVPFFYSLPGWYLVDRVEPLPAVVTIALILLYAPGLWMFRGANEQKHRFKLEPQIRIWGRPARTLGGRLLVSGFWGLLRKPNYTGEILMYWAWTLPCGFDSIVPYLPALWLTAFLPHRALRDDRRCREKYGALWASYCERVRYRMLPFVF